MTGSIVALARALRRYDPMETIDAANISVTTGLEGDRRGAISGRQITLIAEEAWQEICLELGTTLPWTHRRANILTRNIILPDRPGMRIRLGTVELAAVAEVHPCIRMDQAYNGLRHALEPNRRGGLACNVISSGRLHIDDPITLLD